MMLNRLTHAPRTLKRGALLLAGGRLALGASRFAARSPHSGNAVALAARAPVAAPKVRPIPMTKPQRLGITVLQALNREASLKQARISVGTDATTVMLNGSVVNAAQQQRAAVIARHHAAGYKIVNSLIIKTSQPHPH